MLLLQESDLKHEPTSVEEQVNDGDLTALHCVMEGGTFVSVHVVHRYPTLTLK
jgi:hypothetical protein